MRRALVPALPRPLRRLCARAVLAGAALSLVLSGVVALPAPADPRAEVIDKVLTLAAARVGPGWTGLATTGAAEMVGLEWQGRQPAAVEVRARTEGGWSAWERLEGDPTEGPDRGSPEHHDRTTAGPLWVGRGVRQVEVRVAEGSPVGLKLHALRAEEPAAGFGRANPAGAAPAQPGIVSRANWGADESFRSLNPGCGSPSYASSVRYAVVHHTAGTNLYNAADSAAIVRSIYYFHTHTNLWCDIGYNFLVDRFGTVFEGRFGGIGSAVIGAHAEGFNTASTGVAVLGTFSTEPVPSPAYGAVRTLLAWKLALHGVDPNATIAVGSVTVRTITGHRDVNATACPGDMGEAVLPQLRLDVALAMGVPVGGAYHPLVPARVLDTRNGTGGPAAQMGPGATIDVKVTGAGGVPAGEATAVVLNVTATSASGPASYLTVWPKGAARPLASNLNFSAGVSVPNLVTARVGADGSVSVYNNLGSVDVVVDVEGWYSVSAAGGSSYAPVNPARVLDTRDGTGAGGRVAQLGPAGTHQLRVTGVGGVPSAGVAAVVLNMTVAAASGPESFLTVWPAGGTRPTASNLNFSAGAGATTNLVVAPVGVDGSVAVYNNLGSTDVIADVAGWFATSAPGASYASISPTRVLDTRYGTGTGTTAPLGPGATLDLAIAGAGGVPSSGVSAVVLNVTVTDPSGPESYLSVFPAGTARPVASNLNFVAGETVANLVVVRVQNGKVSIYNNLGQAHVVADVQGWFAGGP